LDPVRQATVGTRRRGREWRQRRQESCTQEKLYRHWLPLLDVSDFTSSLLVVHPNAKAAGYNFGLNKLNQFNGNFRDAEMVKAFILSGEYRTRFP
jgi:hypothetical protein